MPHLNLRTSHSITFPVGDSIKKGPNNARHASMESSSSALASDDNRVLSVDFEYSENNLSSNGSRDESRDANCRSPLTPRACMESRSC